MTDTVPIYGAPVPFVTGLDFNPMGFGAYSVGAVGDITDGQMNFTIAGQVANSAVTAVKSVSLSERGDYTLVGTGTSATEVVAGAVLILTVSEIDGIAVAPILLNTVDAEVGFNLPANPGLAKPWALGISVDVEGQLTSLGVPFIVGATKVDVALNNTLIALSEPSTIAFIAKKDFIIGVGSQEGIIPEPSSLALAGLALCGIGAMSRRRIA